ncbi:MAG: Multidrug resistance protein MdtL [Accumulibacter sp.]|uniref:MFS transporter n=1 Tax=Accumulibacter sp. TaxID=2053492 RepID=UPI001216CCCD|nr:MFS transporter [Accumulibacter sp.]TLD45609.1 MAG: Multidrug resistance protein MdtL [Accumulibacter sp.]
MTGPDASKPAAAAAAGGRYRSLPKSIWLLGMVSMFMDISSELVHCLLPIFMAGVLGTSMLTIGIVEGIAEATAAIAKVFSGAISDRFRKRKLLVVLGYGLGAVSKPAFPLASTIDLVFAARFVDRIGKGIRGAPRDALVADLVPARQRGAAYGLRQALDSAGAFLGPLLAIVFMLSLASDIRRVLWMAVVPAFVAVLLALALREPRSPPATSAPRDRLRLQLGRSLPRHFWLIVTLGAAFTLARFSEAFLLLRAHDLGLAAAHVPAILIVMNAVYAALAYPAGDIADRLPARTLLVPGLGVLVAADVVLALAESPATVFVGAALWGLHMALTQGLLAKLVADAAPESLRATAFGIFNMVTGGALLLASVVAGWLWSTFGAAATFSAGGAFAAVAALGVLLYRPQGSAAAGSA